VSFFFHKHAWEMVYVRNLILKILLDKRHIISGAGYLPLRSLLSLGNGSIAIVPLPSFRWAMKSTNTQL
ncbi:MAG: hypothetical protein CVV48_16670, partial [Spirochaetae bacterium HGW-Spirochaetae-4]